MFLIYLIQGLIIMKILLIRNKYEKDYKLGYVLYYENTKSFFIELIQDVGLKVELFRLIVKISAVF